MDAPSDIYSLGVILYELLTGHRPYEFKRSVADDVAKAIRDSAPASPSGSLSREATVLPMYADSPETLDRIFETRNSSLESLRLELRGDLDRIILKTLRKIRQSAMRPSLIWLTTYELRRGPACQCNVFPIQRLASTVRRQRPRLRYCRSRLWAPPYSDTGDFFLASGWRMPCQRLSGIRAFWCVRRVRCFHSQILTLLMPAPTRRGFVLDGNVRQAGDRLRISGSSWTWRQFASGKSI